MTKDTLYRIEHEIVTDYVNGIDETHRREASYYIAGVCDTIIRIVEELETDRRALPEEQEEKPRLQQKKRGRPKKIDIEELERMWDQGVRTRELAEYFGVSAKTINKYVTMLRAEEDRIMG